MVVEVVEMVVVRVLIAVIVKMKVVVKDYYYHHLLALVYSSIYISPGALLMRSLAISFLPTASSLNKEPTIGFLASNVEMSSKTNSSGFSLLAIILLIGSSFCLKFDY